MKVSLSRLSGAKGCTKASFSRRNSDKLFPGLLETHITYFIWVQHILLSHSISGWICYSLSSFLPTSKYVQEWTGSECSYQSSLKNDGKWRFLNNPFSSKLVQGHTINLVMLNVMNVNWEHRILLLSSKGVTIDLRLREGGKAREMQRRAHLRNAWQRDWREAGNNSNFCQKILLWHRTLPACK